MNKTITAQEISNMDRRYRSRLFNCISGYKTAILIGTKSAGGQTNLALFASLTHIGANPPLLGFVLRPESVERHTMENIRQTGSYTINYVSADLIEKAHRTSAKFPHDVSEFDACGFTEEYIDGVPAPFVSEASIKMAMQLKEEIPIKLNDTLLVIGVVEHLIVPEDILHQDGFADLSKQSAVVVSGLEAYYNCTPVTRLAYVRPDEEQKTLPI